MKDLLGYILLAAGVVGLVVGIRVVSGGENVGWAGIVVGPLLLTVAYRLMIPSKEQSSVEVDSTKSKSHARDRLSTAAEDNPSKPESSQETIPTEENER